MNYLLCCKTIYYKSIMITSCSILLKGTKKRPHDKEDTDYTPSCNTCYKSHPCLSRKFNKNIHRNKRTKPDHK